MSVEHTQRVIASSEAYQMMHNAGCKYRYSRCRRGKVRNTKCFISGGNLGNGVSSQPKSPSRSKVQSIWIISRPYCHVSKEFPLIKCPLYYILNLANKYLFLVLQTIVDDSNGNYKDC